MFLFFLPNVKQVCQINLYHDINNEGFRKLPPHMIEVRHGYSLINKTKYGHAP